MLRSFSSRQISLGRSLATLVIPSNPLTRHNWLKEEIQEIYDTPLLDLVFRSASVHRQHHNPNKIQLCTLMNIKSPFLGFISLIILIYVFFFPCSWRMQRRLLVVNHSFLRCTVLNANQSDRRFLLLSVVEIFDSNNGFKTC